MFPRRITRRFRNLVSPTRSHSLPGTWRRSVVEGLEPRQLLASDSTQSVSPRSTVVVSAAGDMGDEIFELLIDGNWVASQRVSTEMSRYSFTIPQSVRPSQVRIQFVNDWADTSGTFDRNLQVDWVSINQTRIETESANVYSTGTWIDGHGIIPGFHRRDYLSTNGYFQYGFDTVSNVPTFDGTGNNLQNPTWGAAGEQFLRAARPAYSDGLNSPSLPSAPNARDVSNRMSAQSGSVENDRFLTAVWAQWGQFLDHDITQAFATRATGPSEPFPINASMPFTRSPFDSDTGTDQPRQQINHISAFIDGSVVYGSDVTRARALRSLSGGRLDSQNRAAGELLPFNTKQLPNAAPPLPTFFVAGDLRANENIALIAMQTLFLREHNRLADQLAKTEFAGRDLSDPAVDEEIYQRARRYVAGLIQNITYNEFLPSTLGFNAIPTYRGYNPHANAQITNEFATAIFRLGHTTLNNELLLGDQGQSITLRDAFSNPTFVVNNGIESIVEGMTLQKMQEVDHLVVDGVRNLLVDGPDGFDLVARNLQRGRDHGLPDYNSVRRAIGLKAVSSFHEVISDKVVADNLTALYGTPDRADSWIVMISEDHVPGTSVGPTIYAYMVDQFVRLRDGDRYWFQNHLDAKTAAEIKATRFSDVIRRNTTGLSDVQNEVFWTRDTLVFRNGLDNEWLIRDTGSLGGAEVVFFGNQGERDPNNRTETIVARRDEPINALVVAGTNERGDGFFIPNPRVPVARADQGVDEFIITANVEFFEGYGLGGKDRWVLESNIDSVFASGDDGDDLLAAKNAEPTTTKFTGGAGRDTITVVATRPSSIYVDSGDSLDEVVISTDRASKITLQGRSHATIVAASDHPLIRVSIGKRRSRVADAALRELTSDVAQWQSLSLNDAERGAIPGVPHPQDSVFAKNFDASGGWVDSVVGDFRGNGYATMMSRSSRGEWWHTDGSTTEPWTVWSASAGWHFVNAGDFDGDGDDDLVGRTASGSWWVAESNGQRMTNRAWGSWNARVAWSDVLVADFTGDGKDDILGRAANGEWWLARSTGTSFDNERWGRWSTAVQWSDVRAGDFNGDGRADVIGRAANGEWWVALSRGNSSTSHRWGVWNPKATWSHVVVGDFNGDGRDDLAGRLGSGVWWVSESNATSIGSTNRLFGSDNQSAGLRDVRVGDFNGDGRDDIVARSNRTGQLWVGASTGSMFRNYTNADLENDWRRRVLSQIQTAFSTPIFVGASLDMRIVPI